MLFLIKNLRLFARVSVGRQESDECEEKIVINYQFFLSNYDKIMAIESTFFNIFSVISCFPIYKNK